MRIDIQTHGFDLTEGLRQHRIPSLAPRILSERLRHRDFVRAPNRRMLPQRVRQGRMGNDEDAVVHGWCTGGQ